MTIGIDHDGERIRWQPPQKALAPGPGPAVASTGPSRIDRPVDARRDHVAGEPDAPIELVEYGDYECPHCREAHLGLKRVRERFGTRLRYVFRHLPNKTLHPNAELAAEAAEAAAAQGLFWPMHDAMFGASGALDRPRLMHIAAEVGLDLERFSADLDGGRHAQRVREDLASALASGARGTPSFFVNGRLYDGAWDYESLREAMEQPLGARVRRLSQDFAGLPASGGLMLLLAALFALIWANSPWSASYHTLWDTQLVLRFASRTLALPLREWINQGLMALFFFVVGLEIKRELTAGELATPRRAALPIVAALGGLAAPMAIYTLFNHGGPGAHGWGIPMSTDTAFALGLLALFGARVPFALRVFVAALAITDDVGAILVIAGFYSSELSLPALAAAAALLLAALGLNRARVYRPWPYAVLGIALWVACVESGLHATIAGITLAMVIPTRPPPSTTGLFTQAVAAFRTLEAPLTGSAPDGSHYQSVVRMLETVVERLLSPAERLERDLQPWSAYFVLPLLALANAGLALGAADFSHPVSLGILAGLVIGKPLGIGLATVLAVRFKLADLPAGVSWRLLAGAACLCGIGFTMSIFVADSAFENIELLELAKLSTILASVVAGGLGAAVLLGGRRELS